MGFPAVPLWHNRTDAADAWLTRTDRGELLESHIRPDGTMLVSGFAAREGVLVYRQADGTTIREFVSKEVLAASAATLGRAPVTLDHPREDVSPDNVGRLGVGDVDGDIRIEADGYVHVRIAVRRRDAIDAIRRGKRELSCGYACRVDSLAGTHPVHGPYDRSQLERVNNHLAIVDVARAGHGAAMRVDGASTTLIARSHTSRGGTLNPNLIRLLSLLGINTRVDSDDGAIELACDAVRTRRDSQTDAERQRADALVAAETALKAEKARADGLATQLAAATKRADEAEAAKKLSAEELAKMKEEGEKKADAAERVRIDSLAKRFRLDAAKFPVTKELKRAIAPNLTGYRADWSDAHVDVAIDAALVGPARKDGREAGREVWVAAANQGSPADPARTDAAPRKSRWSQAFDAAHKP